jgi:hypothetical protein
MPRDFAIYGASCMLFWLGSFDWNELGERISRWILDCMVLQVR